MSWNIPPCVENATLFWAPCSPVYNSSYWPKHVRDRVRSTYTYFTSGIGVTAVAAYAAARTQFVTRFLVTRPILVRYVSTYNSCMLCGGDLASSA